jgi:hypothetical protein
METTKEYIGHGTKHNEFDLIDVVLDMEKAEGHIYTYEGKRYLKFSVAKRKEVSKYGSTHTTYVRAKAEAQAVAAEPPAEQPKRRKKKAQ